MGSVLAADHHRASRRGPLPGSGRRDDHGRARRRCHRHRPARGHREPCHRPQEERRPASAPDAARTMRASETEAARYMLAPGTTLSVEDGQRVEAGDILARASREAAKTRDITGGLPRVAELFEARFPRTLRSSPRSRAGSNSSASTRPSARSRSSRKREHPVEYLIPKTKVIDVQEGDFVKKGDTLISGSPEPARHPRGPGRRGAGRISGRRDPGSLPSAGREDQRQAHRGDRSPDAAEGRDHRWRRHHAAAGRAG